MLELLLYFTFRGLDENQSSETLQYKIFQNYYSKLVECLPTKELSHYLVSDGVITLTESEDITSLTTAREVAAEKLLGRVSASLQKGNVVKFNKLLSIMHKHGNGAIVSLSSEIQSHMNKTSGK